MSEIVGSFFLTSRRNGVSIFLFPLRRELSRITLLSVTPWWLPEEGSVAASEPFFKSFTGVCFHNRGMEKLKLSNRLQILGTFPASETRASGLFRYRTRRHAQKDTPFYNRDFVAVFDEIFSPNSVRPSTIRQSRLEMQY